MSRSHTISLCLIGTGAIAWAIVGRPLVNNHEVKVPLNPLGINGSPYGEVLAMAMQGPVDAYADIGMNGVGHAHGADGECSGHDHAAGEECSDHDGHAHAADEECSDHEGHDHAEGETCAEHDHAEPSEKMAKNAPGIGRRFRKFLTSLGALPDVRTNPYAAGERLKIYLRRKAEDKLRFAYHLDPAHYGNYVVLHFFLTEPSVGTRRQLTSESVKLANETIDYCMKRDDDPRPALTAAAAATNILDLMFADQQKETPVYTTAQMRECLSLADVCLKRYVSLSEKWNESHNWELLSQQRIEECEDRFAFIIKIRDSAEQAILRMEASSQPQVGSDPSGSSKSNRSSNS
ncbi:MAG: hypothetical protein V4640_00150 [Verrucomicrobiota bacterium]